MYQTLTFLHSLARWFVLLSLLCSMLRAYQGYKNKGAVFSATDNAIRHWTATIAHIQLMLGVVLYMHSPITKYFWFHFSEAKHNFDNLFFSLLHIIFMLIGIAVLTVGSAKTKREPNHHVKFKTMLIWYSIAFILIFIAIPWPFSPLAHRPYLR